MAESATTIVADNASAGTTRPLTCTETGSKISDYFERRATALVRKNSGLSMSSAVSSPYLGDNSADQFSPEHEDKTCELHLNSDHKITSGNGRQVARRLQIPKKRVKRQVSFDNETDRPSQRHGSRAKLALLPSLPLDVLFEVRIQLCVVFVLLMHTHIDLPSSYAYRYSSSLSDYEGVSQIITPSLGNWALERCVIKH